VTEAAAFVWSLKAQTFSLSISTFHFLVKQATTMTELIDYESLARHIVERDMEDWPQGRQYEICASRFRMHADFRLTLWECQEAFTREWGMPVLRDHDIISAQRLQRLYNAGAMLVQDRPLDLGEYAEPFDDTYALTEFILLPENDDAITVELRGFLLAEVDPFTKGGLRHATEARNWLRVQGGALWGNVRKLADKRRDPDTVDMLAQMMIHAHAIQWAWDHQDSDVPDDDDIGDLGDWWMGRAA
jgi:hypothetical protein